MSATEFPKVRLPRLRTSVAQAQSLIARHGAAVRISLPVAAAPAADTPDESAANQALPAASTRWRIGLTPGAIDAVQDGAGYWADVEWSGSKASIGLPAAGLRAWAAAHSPDLPLGDLPEPLAAAALETLLAAALAGLDSMSSAGAPRVVRIHGGGPTTLPHDWTLAVQAEATGDTAYASLQFDDLGLMLLAGVLSGVPPAGNELDADTLPVTLRAHIGRSELSVRELAALASGDVILLDEYRVSDQGELWLALDNGQALRVRAQASSYIVTQAWSRLMNESTSSQEHNPQTADADQVTTPASPVPGDEALGAAAGEDGEARSAAVAAPGGDDGAGAVAAPAFLDTDSLPVVLNFDLGDRRIALADLRRLQPGEVFDLQRPLNDGSVMIRANGVLVGTGELVDVDGRIGVMVRTLGKGSA